MSDSRMRFLLDMIGGAENLPPKLPPQEASEEQAPGEVDKEAQPPPIIRDPNLQPPSQLHVKVNTFPPAAMIDEDGMFALDCRKGEPSALGIAFTPFAALTKYCYKFVPRQWMQPLASAFFDADKIYQRDWDLYYVNSDYCGLLVFVPVHQLQALLNDINNDFPDADLAVDDEARESGLLIDFEDLPDLLRPRWLGHCNSRSQYNSWVSQLQREPLTMLPDSGDRSLEAFKAKMDQALEANKKKTKAAQARRHQEIVVKRQDMVKELLRTQRYLGLLPKREASLLPDISNLSISTYDAANPPPHPFDNEPIFIAIDVEAYEKPPRMITEVGVATLDTRDLKGIAPGDAAKDWRDLIRGRHFRISEYKNFVNREYVQGCPDGFEFGQSEFVSKHGIASVLTSCFHEPFSRTDTTHEPFSRTDTTHEPFSRTDTTHDSPLRTTQPSTPSAEPEKRNLIIVGHDLGQDVNYCHQLGFSIFNRGNIIDTADTVNIYRAYSKDPNPCSLGKILYDFDISGWHLHNAGNDAVYTVQALLAISVASATQRGSEEAQQQREAKLQQREQTFVENARLRATADSEGWSSPDGDDGGVPLVPKQQDFDPRPKMGPRGPLQTSQSGLYTLMGNPLDV